MLGREPVELDLEVCILTTDGVDDATPRLTDTGHRPLHQASVIEQLPVELVKFDALDFLKDIPGEGTTDAGRRHEEVTLCRLLQHLVVDSREPVEAL